MNNNLIDTETLKTITGHRNIASLEKCLRDQKIPFLYGKSGYIFTTIEAIHHGMGITKTEEKQEEIQFLR